MGLMQVYSKEVAVADVSEATTMVLVLFSITVEVTRTEVGRVREDLNFTLVCLSGECEQTVWEG